ncbi:MAG: carbon-nitrogen hydrolase family protein [Candidatus Poribacteria bacterium]|nr:carbon-nitrogen hydrolase family protein [Candidatus Poribacteria bacterium]
MAAIQTCCEVGDVPANLRNAKRLIQSARDDGAVLVCLPELFTTGIVFGKMDKLAEPIPGPTTQEFGKIAKANSVYLVAGMAEKDVKTGRLHNASVLISPQGELLQKYRKIFLYLDESKGFVPGDRPCICDLPLGKIGITICYDYVFPEYIRHLAFEGIDLLVHPTAWLTTDECERWNYNNGAYRAMGMTRALENGIYFISANHWGNYDLDGNLRAIGQSSIISPWGEILDEVTEGEGIAIADVDFEKPEGWRANVAPYLSDYREASPRLEFLKNKT